MAMTGTFQPSASAALPASQSAPVSTRVPLLVLIFMFALIVPLILNLGPLRLSVYRLALLIAFIPSFFIWVSGRAGKIIWADIMIVLTVFWMGLSHTYHYGVSASVEPVGIMTLEHLGAYLLGRSFIRSADVFRKMAWVAFLLCLILLPFGLYESLTANNLYLSLWDKAGNVPQDVYKDPRLGLDRFQGPFDHPILPGVFATPILGLACYVLAYQRGSITSFMLTLVVFTTGFLCVSSGPISALFVQLGLILWNKVLGRVEARWWILLVLTIIAYVVVDILSNRTPIEVAISYLAFNASTGYARVNIWYWGWVNILENPLFGLGLGEWKRYAFMTYSFDMFWLLYAMQWGLIAGIAQTLSAFLLMCSLIFTKMTDPRLVAYRLGWLVGIGGIVMAGWMVHFWNAPLVLYFFVLGAGAWMLDAARKPTEEGAAPEAEEAPTGLRYSRFPDRSAPVRSAPVQRPVHSRTGQPRPQSRGR